MALNTVGVCRSGLPKDMYDFRVSVAGRDLIVSLPRTTPTGIAELRIFAPFLRQPRRCLWRKVCRIPLYVLGSRLPLLVGEKSVSVLARDLEGEGDRVFHFGAR